MTMNRFPANTGINRAGFFVGDEPLLAQDAIKKGGIDWTVSKRKVSYETPNGSVIDPSYNAIVRDDNQHRLGIVKAGYTPVQNLQAFSFLDGLAKNGKIAYHSVGTFQGGRKVWVLAKVGESEVLPNYITDHHILRYNSHDGSSCLSAVTTSIRVACTNAILSMIAEGKNIGIRIRHTRSIHSRMDDARDILKMAKEHATKMHELAKRMTEIKIFSKKLDRITYGLFPDPPANTGERAKANAQSKRDEISNLFYNGQGQDIAGVPNTGWAMFNAITEYANHTKSVRGNDSTRRVESLLLGQSNNLIARAKDLILQAA
jgi:phage/plasmid-like protein (TIGR03299 family)